MGEVNKLTVAAIQMNCVLADKEKNFEHASGLIDEAIHEGANLIIVPELFNTGYRVEEKDVELSETIPGETTEWMVNISKERDVTLVGCILEHDETRGIVYDTAIVTNANGIVGKYRKTHLWDQENTRFAKGEELPVFDLEWGKLGIQICYEIGYPDNSRILALKGADLIVYPSAFGKQRLYAWDIATRSRALENGCYVVAANRTGIEKKETEFGGHSRIVDPKGQVIVQAEQENEVIVSQIELTEVTKQRRTIPYLRDLNKSLIVNELEKISVKSLL